MRPSLPRIRVEIIEKTDPEAPLRRGMQPHWWGLRILNDGAAAVFDVLMDVRDGDVSMGTRQRPLTDSESGKPRARIETGAEGIWFIGRIDRHLLHRNEIGAKRLLYFDAQVNRIVETELQGSGQEGKRDDPKDATAEVEITITSDPPLLEGPWRRSYRFGPEMLVELTA